MTSGESTYSNTNKDIKQHTPEQPEQRPFEEHTSLPILARQAKIDPRLLTPQGILQLQRTIGNHAVGHFLSASPHHQTIQRQNLSAIQHQAIANEILALRGNTDLGNLTTRVNPDVDDMRAIGQIFTGSNNWKASGQTTWLRTEAVVGQNNVVKQIRIKRDGGHVKINLEIFQIPVNQQIVLKDNWSATGQYKQYSILDFHVYM